VNNTVGDCSDTLRGVRFAFLDEYSFINCRHLSHISQSIRNALNMNGADGRCFADLNVILCGDLCQHRPVTCAPLFTDNAERQAYNALLRSMKAKQGFQQQFQMSAVDRAECVS
jgi:hypothetical protein